MPYEIRVEEEPDVLVATVTAYASQATVGKQIQEGFAELWRVVGPVGYGNGMPGVIYHDVIDHWVDGTVEMFMPVARSFDAPEPVEVKTLPDGRFATTIHRGPYAECERAYEALRAWIAERGLEIAGPTRELYLNDPREVGEDEALTKIEFPIR